LPLIYALSKASWLEKRKIIGLIKNESENPRKVREVISFVKSKGGIGYAQQAMERYHQKALDLLCTLPDSDYKTSLRQLVQFTIERKS
jgi:octaprenyl-diphosphate synthase